MEFSSNKQLKNHRHAASELSQQLSTKQEQLNSLKDKQQFLAKRLTSLDREIEQQDRAVHKLNRLIFYRQRGDIVLQALSPLQNR
jgi:peptidoglycan hydrolase CwlO-like protein